MYIVKNFLSDMAYSASGGERPQKIMMFQQENFFGTLSDFRVMAIIRPYKGRSGMLRGCKF